MIFKMEFVMSILLFGLASAAASRAMMSHLKNRAMLRKMGIASGPLTGSPPIDLFLKLGAPMRPLILKIPRIGGSRRIRNIVSAAGFAPVVDAEALFAALVPAASAGCALAFLLCDRPGAVPVLVGALSGPAFLAARIRARVRARRERIELDLPHALDWMSLSVEAGLDFVQALGRITARMRPGPLKEEFTKVEGSIRTGMTRREALSRMAQGASVPALSSFASMLIQADALGTSIGPVLKSQASKLRAGRFARAERKGVAAQQKALVPIAICVVPATFIIVFGPLVARLVTGGIDSLFR